MARFKVKVGGSEAWFVVCEKCLEAERKDVQRGCDPPHLKYFTPTARPRAVAWWKIRAALSYHDMTKYQIAEATGLAVHTVKDVLTEHRDKDVTYTRRAKSCTWELLNGKETLDY